MLQQQETAYIDITTPVASPVTQGPAIHGLPDSISIIKAEIEGCESLRGEIPSEEIDVVVAGLRQQIEEAEQAAEAAQAWIDKAKSRGQASKLLGVETVTSAPDDAIKEISRSVAATVAKATQEEAALPTMRPTIALRALKRAGVAVIPGGGKGSHVKIFNPETGRTTTITMHKGKDVPPRLLRKILGQLEIPLSEFKGNL